MKFAPEFKAEAVRLCQAGDRSVGQVARDLDLTETAPREWGEKENRQLIDKDDLESRSEISQHPSRRRFIYGAGGAGIVAAGLALWGCRRSVIKTTPLVLPTATKDITPFKVDVPQAALDDLKERLANTRWPDKEPVTDWSQGVPLSKAQSLVEYWRTRYDWRPVERTLNDHLQFRTQLDGLGFHFIHVRSKHKNALPMILTHGWPGSVFEFLQVIAPLTDPTANGGKADDAFHVVIPSLPGFGFSDKPTEPGWRLPRIANAWAALMAACQPSGLS